jgi:hypothetical protein
VLDIVVKERRCRCLGEGDRSQGKAGRVRGALGGSRVWKNEERTSETQLIKYVPGKHRQECVCSFFGSIFIFFEFLVSVATCEIE